MAGGVGLSIRHVGRCRATTCRRFHDDDGAGAGVMEATDFGTERTWGTGSGNRDITG